PRRVLLRPARSARRGARRAVRRRVLLPDVHPAAADLPGRRLLLGHAAGRALPDADALQPRLLHDRPGALRLPRLLGSQRRAVAGPAVAGDRRPVRDQPPPVHDRLPPARLMPPLPRLPLVSIPRLPLVPDPLRRARIPRDLDAVTVIGREENPREVGMTAASVARIW